MIASLSSTDQCFCERAVSKAEKLPAGVIGDRPSCGVGLFLIQPPRVLVMHLPREFVEMLFGRNLQTGKT